MSLATVATTGDPLLLCFGHQIPSGCLGLAYLGLPELTPTSTALVSRPSRSCVENSATGANAPITLHTVVALPGGQWAPAFTPGSFVRAMTLGDYRHAIVETPPYFDPAELEQEDTAILQWEYSLSPYHTGYYTEETVQRDSDGWYRLSHRLVGGSMLRYAIDGTEQTLQLPVTSTETVDLERGRLRIVAAASAVVTVTAFVDDLIPYTGFMRYVDDVAVFCSLDVNPLAGHVSGRLPLDAVPVYVDDDPVYVGFHQVVESAQFGEGPDVISASTIMREGGCVFYLEPIRCLCDGVAVWVHPHPRSVLWWTTAAHAIAPSPYAVELGRLALRTPLVTDEITLVDIRQRGTPSTPTYPLDQLPLDGEPSFEHGAVCVTIDAAVLAQHGESRVRAMIASALPAGITYVLEEGA